MTWAEGLDICLHRRITNGLEKQPAGGRRGPRDITTSGLDDVIDPLGWLFAETHLQQRANDVAHHVVEKRIGLQINHHQVVAPIYV